MSLIADVSAAEAAVQDLIDLDVATHGPSVSPQLKRRLTLMRQRREQEVPGVRVSVAAKMLGLSERTTRDWLADGPLDPVPGATAFGERAARNTRGKVRESLRGAVEALERSGCDAAGYRLTGAGVEHFCIVHLWGRWRLLLGFREPTVAVIVDTPRHTRLKYLIVL